MEEEVAKTRTMFSQAETAIISTSRPTGRRPMHGNRSTKIHRNFGSAPAAPPQPGKVYCRGIVVSGMDESGVSS